MEKPEKMDEEQAPEDVVLKIIKEMKELDFGEANTNMAEAKGKSEREGGETEHTDRVSEEGQGNGNGKREETGLNDEDLDVELFAGIEGNYDDDLDEQEDDEADQTCFKVDLKYEDKNAILYEWDNEVVFSAGDDLRHVVPKIKEISEEEVCVCVS